MEKMMLRAKLARGDQAVELVLKNCKVVNVFNGLIEEGNLAIDHGKIIGMGDYQGLEVRDMGGKYIAPGLIDAHMHMESTLVTPDQMAIIIVPQGTTTVICDPHEIANVLGLKGVEFMMNVVENTPLNGFFMLPSCVPATPLENAGATLDARALSQLINHPRVLGLGEVMNYPGVIHGDPDVLEKMLLAERKLIDGHGPEISGMALNAYVINGVRTEHECTSLNEMQERLGLGMYIAIREGSAARNLEKLIPGVNHKTKHMCMFCTDDKHPEDILTEGHINYNVKQSIAMGIDPVTAIQMATINPATCYHLRDIGALAPGYDADLIVIDDLDNFKILEVYKKGIPVAKDGVALFEPQAVVDDSVKNTVRIGTVTEGDFIMPLTSDVANVIRISPGSIVTEHVVRKVEVTSDNTFTTHPYIDIVKLAVIERYKGTGNIGLGLVENFKLQGGAIATTIAHDSHNIIVIGDNDQDMALAVNHLKGIQGGIVVYGKGQCLGDLSLPIAGLMSDKPMEEVSEKLRHLRQAAYDKLGVNRALEPFMTLSFLALPVIPELKLTDKGYFDVKSFDYMPLSVKRAHF